MFGKREPQPPAPQPFVIPPPPWSEHYVGEEDPPSEPESEPELEPLPRVVIPKPPWVDDRADS